MLTRKEIDPNTVMASFSLRLPAELKDAIDDLASSAGMDTSELVIPLIQTLVDANVKRIENFRELAKEPLTMLTFAPEDATSA